MTPKRAPFRRTRTVVQLLTLVSLVAALLVSAASPANADGSESLGPPSIPIATGSGISIGGIGLLTGPDSISVEVPAGAAVQQVLLYWEGQSQAKNVGFDAQVRVNGNIVPGTLIGGPTRFFVSAWSRSYRADITALGLVGPGSNSLLIQGMNFDRASNGAGVVVIWDDGTDSEIRLADGNDLAYFDFVSPLDTTTPQTFTIAPAAVGRVADIPIHVSSVRGPDFEGPRPNIIRVTVDGVVTDFPDLLASNQGEEWDAVTVQVGVPAGATSITVQLLSADAFATGNRPASMAWVVGGVSVPVPTDDPGIDIEKLTNGNQADGANDADVPQIAAGDDVTWTYIVTNTGDVAFAQADVTVADDTVAGLVLVDDGNSDGILSPGEIWTYEAKGTALDLEGTVPPGTTIVDGCNPNGGTVPGDRATYENIGTVTVPGDTDRDPSHYCNPPDPGIDIEKLTNGNQADGANDNDVPQIAPGDDVTWTYIVTNTGAIAYAEADVTVVDDTIGPIATIVDKGDGDGILAPGEVWTYEATGTAGDLGSAPPANATIVKGCNPDETDVPGDRATYENIGTVTVPGDTDSDPSHYCNPPDPGIDIEKLTNGNQADGANDADVPQIAAGDDVTWTYIVTNTGDVAFAQADVTVADDTVAGLVLVDDGNSDGILSPGEIWTYEAKGTALDLEGTVPPGTTIVDGCNPNGGTVPGDRATYENIGTVTVPGDTDRDPSHYCNPPDPGIDIEKLTNGNQADGANDNDVPQIAPGDDVTWTYIVTNTGAIAYAEADVTVVDDTIGPIATIVDKGDGDGILAPGEVWTYEATGTALDLDAFGPIPATIVRGCNPDETDVPGDRATYENIGTVEVPGSTDSDPSHYCNPPDPGIDIEKLTNGNQADGANDADVPQIAAGDDVTWTYIVTNTGDVAFAQADVTVADDTVAGLVLVDDGNSDGILSPGEIWTYEAKGTALDLEGTVPPGTTIVDGCNPNGGTVPGDRATYENIGTVTVPGDTDRDPSHYCNSPGANIDIEKFTKVETASQDGDLCETLGKPVALTLRYVGGNVITQNQEGRATAVGDPGTTSPVRFLVTEDGGGDVYFDGIVGLHETFVADNNGGTFSSNSMAKVFHTDGTLLQTIQFHTSCSKPLNLGDQFGSFVLAGFEDEDGNTVTMPDPDPTDIGFDADTPTGPEARLGATIRWTYLVTTTGDLEIVDLVVTDDNGTPSDTSDDFTPTPIEEAGFNVGDDDNDGRLDPGEEWRYTATGIAKLGQYANLGDVVGQPVDSFGTPVGGPVDDIDPSHYIGMYGDDLCDAFEKAGKLTMRYTGDGDDATSHSQDSGSVNVSGDPNDASPVRIVASSSQLGGGDIWFDGTVLLGETFVIDSANQAGSKDQLGSKTFVTVYSPSGNLLQSIEFHTSCSQPLFLGDQFGSIRLVDFVDKNGNGPGGSTPPSGGADVIVTKLEAKNKEVKFKLKNEGDETATIVRLDLEWPNAKNGALKQIKQGSKVLYSSSNASSPLTVTSFSNADKLVLEDGKSKEYKLVFAKNVHTGLNQYSIVVTFDDGSTLVVAP